MGEEDADADVVGVVAVSVVLLLLMKNWTGDQMQMNMGEKNVAVAAATMESTTGVDNPGVAIVSKGGEEGEEDMDKTTTTGKGGPLQIMALIQFPHLRPRHMPRTRRHHLNLLRHRTHNRLHPLLHHLCLHPLP